MNSIFKSAVKGLLIGLTIKLLLSLLGYQIVKKAEAAEYHLLKPSQVMIEGEKYDYLRDPYIPQYTDRWSYGTALAIKVDLAAMYRNNVQYRLFYDPTLKFRATHAQVRQGGLYYEAGAEILSDKGLRFFRRHESLHCLECNHTSREYPVLDSWVVQLIWNLK